jgi:hypothetical protein
MFRFFIMMRQCYSVTMGLSLLAAWCDILVVYAGESTLLWLLSLLAVSSLGRHAFIYSQLIAALLHYCLALLLDRLKSFAHILTDSTAVCTVSHSKGYIHSVCGCVVENDFGAVRVALSCLMFCYHLFFWYLMWFSRKHVGIMSYHLAITDVLSDACPRPCTLLISLVQLPTYVYIYWQSGPFFHSKISKIHLHIHYKILKPVFFFQIGGFLISRFL